MLDANLKTQLQAYLEKVTQPFEIVASLDDSAKAAEMLALLQDIVGLSDKIALATDGSDSRKPSFSFRRDGRELGIRFAGLPMGHEFTSLVLALLQVGGYPPKVSDEVIAQIQALPGEFRFETYFSLSCQNCPDVVQALNLMAVLNPNIQHVAIDGALFQAEVEARQIMAVPRSSPSWTPTAARARPRSSTARPPSTCWWSAAARPALRRPSTPRARASAPASPASA